MRSAAGLRDAIRLCAGLLVIVAAEPHLGGGRYIGKSRLGSSLINDAPAHVDALSHPELTHGELTHGPPAEQVSLLAVVHSESALGERSRYVASATVEGAADVRFTRRLRNGIGNIVFGIIFFMISVPIQWYNEVRTARMESLTRCALAECVSINPEEITEENHGRLVHAQGWARAAAPLVDRQFPGARVAECLKLQSTVEVFEWIQVTRTLMDGKGKWTQPRFHTEWTTVHQDSQRFKKPSPENPRLPSSIFLGTFTQVCPLIQLGSFALTKEMVDSFCRYELAMKRLPPTLEANGFTFFANPEDGYYYMRPGVSTADKAASRLLTEHQVGDVRARFMCVPECEATIVAVQCTAYFEGGGTFVPYRPIPRGPCVTDCQVREKRVEEGGKLLDDIKAESGCRTRGYSGCACCACNVIAGCCQSEKVTEEIFYASDCIDPKERPFSRMVPRNPLRVWLSRLTGWGVMYLGTAMVLGPFADVLQRAPGLTAYGTAAAYMLSAIVTLATAGCIMLVVMARYEPFMVLWWLLYVALIIAAPLLWGGLSPYAKQAAPLI